MDLLDARNEMIAAIEKAGFEVPWAECGSVSGEFGVTIEGDEYQVTVKRAE